MKPLLINAAIGALSLAGAGCSSGPSPMARVALDCPEIVHGLHRTTAEAKTCAYSDREGDEITLRLIPVAGTPDATLLPIEQDLEGERIAKSPEDLAKSPASKTNKTKPTTKSEGDEDGDGVSGDSEHTQIDMPGIHIRANDNGQADVNVGMVHVKADSDGDVVRVFHDVRLRGEALSRERRGFRAAYILSETDLKDGFRAVGYEAGGPKVGPITVAIIKTKSGDHDGLVSAAKRLVRRNAGI